MGGSMNQTEFLITKYDFSIISRAIHKALDEGVYDAVELKRAEDLIEVMSDKIFNNGTTRQNWQVVKYNDPAWKNHYNRQQYSHYGAY